MVISLTSRADQKKNAVPLSLYWLGFVSIYGTRIYDGLVGIVGVLPRRDLDSKLVP